MTVELLKNHPDDKAIFIDILADKHAPWNRNVFKKWLCSLSDFDLIELAEGSAENLFRTAIEALGEPAIIRKLRNSEISKEHKAFETAKKEALAMKLNKQRMLFEEMDNPDLYEEFKPSEFDPWELWS